MIKRVLAVVTVILLSMMTAMLGAIAVAPAAQACPSGCEEVTVRVPGGSGEYCSVEGVTETLSWAGASAMENYVMVRGARCDYPTYEAAHAAALARATAQVANNKRIATTGYAEGACVPDVYNCLEVSDRVSDGGWFCNAEGVDTYISWSGSGSARYHEVVSGNPTEFGCCPMTQTEAQEAALLEAQENAMLDMRKQTEGATPGLCTPPTPTYSATGLTEGSVDYCAVDGTTVVVTYTGAGSATSTVSQADANFVAQQQADAAAQADLAAKTPSGATLGACAPAAPATVEPVVVAQPEPAVVAPEQVSIPEAATVPKAVPAGDGTTAPQVPVLLLVMAALAAVGAVTAARRLAGNR